VEERIKYILRKRTLHGLEQQLTLEKSTSRMAHVDRERETHLQNNIEAKHEQLKLNKS
jgi:hypothetical protein